MCIVQGKTLPIERLTFFYHPPKQPVLLLHQKCQSMPLLNSGSVNIPGLWGEIQPPATTDEVVGDLACANILTFIKENSESVSEDCV